MRLKKSQYGKALNFVINNQPSSIEGVLVQKVDKSHTHTHTGREGEKERNKSKHAVVESTEQSFKKGGGGEGGEANAEIN